MIESTIATETALPARASFAADPAEIARAVSWLARKVTERRNTIPIVSCLLIEADISGAVTFTATDLDLWASVTIAAKVASPGLFCVDASLLAALMDKARKVRVYPEVKLSDGDFVSIKSGHQSLKLPRLPADDFPLPIGGMGAALSAECDGVAFTASRARFVADLAALDKCASREEVRYYLNGICLQVADMAGRASLVMAATDGHQMGIASRPLPDGAEGLPETILPNKAVALLIGADKVAGDGDALAVAWQANKAAGLVRFGLGAVAIVAKAIDGTFPDYARPWLAGGPLAPSDAQPALFPDLLPGAPGKALENIAKAAGVPVQWEPAACGLIGTVAGDAGLVFGAMATRGDATGKFTYEYEGEGEARAYLLALAESLGLPSIGEFEARAEAINAANIAENGNGGGRTAGAMAHASLVTEAGQVRGLTINATQWRQGWTEIVQDWEALCERTIHHPGGNEAMEGAYSILMPPERAQLTPSSYIEGPDGVTYPVAVNERAIHFSKEQVRALIGESCFETMAIAAPGGRTVHILKWLWDDGAGGFLTVRPDGRCFAGKDAWKAERITREQVEAWQAGEGVEPEAVEPAQLPAPVACESEAAPAAAPMPPEPVEALSGPVSGAVQLSDDSGQLPAPPIGEIMARLDALEASVATLSAGSAGLPHIAASDEGEKINKPARTPAHERAIRRAWAERRARRMLATGNARLGERVADLLSACNEAEAVARTARTDAETWEAAARENFTAHGRERAKRRRAVLLARRHWKMRLVARYQYQAAERYGDFQRKARQKAAAIGRTAALQARAQRDKARADLAKLRASMADPHQPERASDIARLVTERDQARTALAALESRAKVAESARDQLAEAFEALVSRLARAEAAVRAAQAA